MKTREMKYTTLDKFVEALDAIPEFGATGIDLEDIVKVTTTAVLKQWLRIAVRAQRIKLTTMRADYFIANFNAELEYAREEKRIVLQ